jgi:hypothetical protein
MLIAQVYWYAYIYIHIYICTHAYTYMQVEIYHECSLMRTNFTLSPSHLDVTGGPSTRLGLMHTRSKLILYSCVHAVTSCRQALNCINTNILPYAFHGHVHVYTQSYMHTKSRIFLLSLSLSLSLFTYRTHILQTF